MNSQNNLQRNASSMMWLTLLALVPGLLAMTWQLGPGVLLNVLTAGATALLTEALALPLLFPKTPDTAPSKRPTTLRDGSALLTGVLIGLAVPPLLPFWMLMLGVVFGMVFGKLIYGGLGKNLFNPAMVAWAMLILSFPLAMSQWPTPATLASPATPTTPTSPATPDWGEGVIAAKVQLTAGRPDYDGLSRATPLDKFKFRGALTSEEFFTLEETRNLRAWVYINLGFLVGGLLLLWLRIVPWVLPISFLGGLLLLALAFQDGGSSTGLGSPGLHLFSGATMLAAFFILTDPVTSPSLNQGLVIFALGAALLTWVIRVAGAYPDGVAFAVLLMNGASPLIDHLLSRRLQGGKHEG